MLGKILSLDELEAKIRKNPESVGEPQKPPPKPDEEMSAAFKKLVRIIFYFSSKLQINIFQKD